MRGLLIAAGVIAAPVAVFLVARSVARGAAAAQRDIDNSPI